MFLCDWVVCLWYMYYVWARLFSACYANFCFTVMAVLNTHQMIKHQSIWKFRPIQNLPKIIREFLIDFKFICLFVLG